MSARDDDFVDAEELFSSAYLSADVAGSFVERMVSRAVRVGRSTVHVYATVHQMVGSAFRTVFDLEGSLDGSRWFTIGSSLQVTAVGVKNSAANTAVAAVWVRLRASVPTGGSPVTQSIFSAGVSFSVP